jgi:TRAP-type C4-dicarboxylate transport system permease small subunit
MLCLAGLALVVLVALICSNIFLRTVWVPIKGTFELVGFLGALVTAFALGFTQMERGHIAVDILVTYFPEKLKRVITVVNSIVCIFVFSIAGFQTMKWGTLLKDKGEVTETLRIIFYPFVYCVAIGCFMLCVVLAVDMLDVFFGPERDDK